MRNKSKKKLFWLLSILVASSSRPKCYLAVRQFHLISLVGPFHGHFSEHRLTVSMQNYLAPLNNIPTLSHREIFTLSSLGQSSGTCIFRKQGGICVVCTIFHNIHAVIFGPHLDSNLLLKGWGPCLLLETQSQNCKIYPFHLIIWKKCEVQVHFSYYHNYKENQNIKILLILFCFIFFLKFLVELRRKIET